MEEALEKLASVKKAEWKKLEEEERAAILDQEREWKKKKDNALKEIAKRSKFGNLEESSAEYQQYYKDCGRYPDCYPICNYIKDEEQRTTCAKEYAKNKSHSSSIFRIVNPNNTADAELEWKLKWDKYVSDNQKPELLEETNQEDLEQKNTEEQLNEERSDLLGDSDNPIVTPYATERVIEKEVADGNGSRDNPYRFDPNVLTRKHRRERTKNGENAQIREERERRKERTKNGESTQRRKNAENGENPRERRKEREKEQRRERTENGEKTRESTQRRKERENGEKTGGKSLKKRFKTKTVSKKKNGSRITRKQKGTRISHRRTKRL